MRREPECLLCCISFIDLRRTGLNVVDIFRNIMTVVLVALISIDLSYACHRGDSCILDSLSFDTSIDSSTVTGVRGSRYREVIPAQTLGRDELEKRSSLSVADAVRYLSGVQVKDYGGAGGLKTVDVRSLGSSHTAVFYDGIQVGNAQNGQVDLGRFSLDDVEEISLYNGQKSDIFQSAGDFASSSSIYVNSRSPHFENGKVLNFKAGVKGGSFGLISPSARVEYKISESLSAAASVGWTNASGRYKFRCRDYDSRGNLAYDTTAVRHNGDICALRVEAALNGRLKNGLWNVRVYNYESNRGIPGAVVSNVFRNGERMRDNDVFVQAGFRNRWTPRFSSMLKAKFASDRTFYEDKDSRTLYVSNTYRQKETYMSCANLFNVTGWLDLSMSWDFRWNSLDADNYMSGNLPFPEPVRFTDMVSFAGAVDLGRFKAQASLLGIFVRDKARASSGIGGRRSEAVPAVSLAYRLVKGQDFYLRSFCKRAFRMPTFNDLYYTNSASASLLPEKAFQLDAGLAYAWKSKDSGLLKDIDLTLDGYWNRVSDKIVAYPNGQQFRWTMLNLGKVDIRGADAVCSAGFRLWKVCAELRLRYTWQKALDITDQSTTYYRNMIPYAPEHSGSACVDLEWRGWGLDYSFLYTGERYSRKENTVKNRLQPWYTSDLALRKTVTFTKVALKVAAEVNNLFGQDYEVVLNYPMPKTNFRISFDIEFQ